MPFNSRNQMRLQAKINRGVGQVVYLLIPVESAPSTATPLSISAADTPVNLSTAKKYPVYAAVRWNAGLFTYGEGGRILTKVADVDVPFDWQSIVTQAYAVEMADGEILIKKSQKLNESQTFYTIQVESNVSTQQ